MGAESSAKNSPNAPEFILPICLPKPKISGFQFKKASFDVRSPWLVGTGAWYYYYFIFLRLKNHNICLKFMIIFREKQVGQY
jgi:hypothetical protein